MFNIEGNSNYKVYIDDGYVIKKSINKSDSKRLEIQCKKQKDFQNKIFKSPQIYNQDTKDGLFWFKMDFIPYETFDLSFKYINKKSLDTLADKLINFIIGNIKDYKKVKRDFIIDKYESTKDKIRIKQDIDISYLNEFFYSLEEEINIPIGYCHGDLTFSNFLINKDEIVLIEFLDTFLDSPLQDIVKLKQDTKYYWSLRKLNTVRDPIKIKQCFSYIDKKLEDKFSNEEYYIKYYKHFQILNLLRIIPYCKNKTDITFLLKNIDNVWQL